MPRGYIVDGQEGIKDPLGMSAVRLEVETHIVAGAATSVQNLSSASLSAGVQIDEMVISSLAAAEATLTDTEKELGVLVADIGGGTTDIAIFVDGAVYHTAVLPVGGINVTNDVAIGLRTSLEPGRGDQDQARHRQPGRGRAGGAAQRGGARGVGRADDPAPEAVRDHRGADGRDLQPHPRGGEALRARRDAAGRGRPDRRRARLAGVEVLARDTLEMPVRVGSPQGVGGLMDQIGNPAFATPIGLLLWGAHHLGEEPIGYGTANGTNPLVARRRVGAEPVPRLGRCHRESTRFAADPRSGGGHRLTPSTPNSPSVDNSVPGCGKTCRRRRPGGR